MFSINRIATRGLATVRSSQSVPSRLLPVGVVQKFVIKSLHTTAQAHSDTLYTPPDLSGIPQRWTAMKNTDLQEEIKEYLYWKMMSPWEQMSQNEQIASYYLAYGTWGPRSDSSQKDKSDINVTYFIFRVMFNIVMISALGVSYVNWRKDRNHYGSD